MENAPFDIFAYGLLSGNTDKKLQNKANFGFIGGIAKSASQAFNVPSSARGFLITSGRDVNTMEIVFYSTNSLGTASVAKTRNASGITVTVDATNTITIENGSTAYGISVFCLPFEGDMPNFITSE